MRISKISNPYPFDIDFLQKKGYVVCAMITAEDGVIECNFCTKKDKIFSIETETMCFHCENFIETIEFHCITCLTRFYNDLKSNDEQREKERLARLDQYNNPEKHEKEQLKILLEKYGLPEGYNDK